MPLNSKIYTSVVLAGIALICLACLILRWRTLALEQETPSIGLQRGPVHYSRAQDAGSSAEKPESSPEVIQPEASPAGNAAPTEHDVALLNINSASAAELDALPGIGPVLAGRIIETRDSIGAFRSVEDLLQVEGIGTSTLEELRPLIRAAP